MRTRILVDGHVLDGLKQGTCSYIAGLYSEVAKDDRFEIFMATSEISSFEEYFGKNSPLKWVELHDQNRYQRLAFGFDKLCDEIRPDYCHFQYVTPLRKRCKWINTIHDVLFLDYPEDFPLSYRLKNHALFRLSALRSDIVLTVSDYSRSRIAEKFGIDQSAIVVTPNAVDGFWPEEGEPVEGLQEREFFICVSRFEPRKNQDALIRAFNNCELPDRVKLVLVGADSVRYPKLEAAIAQHPTRVVKLSNIPRSKLKWLYQNAIASIYPSKGEGFGIPPIEASTMGCLSFCSDNTALSELRPYVNGMFDSDAELQISEIMKRCYLGSYLDNDLRLKVMERFSWKRTSEVFISSLLNRN